MKFTETMLNNFSQPLSNTEDQQCKNAINMVVNSIKPLGFQEKSLSLEPMYADTYSYYQVLESTSSNRRIKIFLQGSYANNTNVRTQSDVDIAVVEEDIFITNYRQGVNDANYRFVTAQPRPQSFKDEIEIALTNTFGTDVSRENKSIKINGNSYRKDADAVPCRRYKDFSLDYRDDPTNYIGGIVISADSGEQVINYPEQHIKNGKEKNVSTNHYYKKMVRIMKKMRYLMKENGISSANGVSSFALESLLWNVPNEYYLEYKDYRKVFMFSKLIDYLNSRWCTLNTFKEANGIKLLCPNSDIEEKMRSFINALTIFYEYE
ncbi:Cyclic dipurine nucleotide synthase [Paenibacillus sp. JJ-100]|uniref:nucleotidyltransferase domain-containing protein n=1 Tax=Paenibacillus sp. JJ-100 TaxID=2974896 RepID=UPI0022FF81A1|nr:nucleotidyltransferase [Paenibacillus sp. JJ-100]CAI6050557.1 Cyclic dipurine nucleotide synthase [Paenibacillus sp. JJ-100]